MLTKSKTLESNFMKYQIIFHVPKNLLSKPPVFPITSVIPSICLPNRVLSKSKGQNEVICTRIGVGWRLFEFIHRWTHRDMLLRGYSNQWQSSKKGFERHLDSSFEFFVPFEVLPTFVTLKITSYWRHRNDRTLPVYFDN